MLRYSPVRYDSRVLREARTLARAGHEVRVIATRDGLPREEQIDLVRIIRVDREPWLAKMIRMLAERGRRPSGAPFPAETLRRLLRRPPSYAQFSRPGPAGRRCG